MSVTRCLPASEPFDGQLKFYGLFAVFQVACTVYTTVLNLLEINGSISRKSFEHSISSIGCNAKIFQSFTSELVFYNNYEQRKQTGNIDKSIVIF